MAVAAATVTAVASGQGGGPPSARLRHLRASVDPRLGRGAPPARADLPAGRHRGQRQPLTPRPAKPPCAHAKRPTESSNAIPENRGTTLSAHRRPARTRRWSTDARAAARHVRPFEKNIAGGCAPSAEGGVAVSASRRHISPISGGRDRARLFDAASTRVRRDARARSSRGRLTAGTVVGRGGDRVGGAGGGGGCPPRTVRGCLSRPAACGAGRAGHSRKAQAR